MQRVMVVENVVRFKGTILTGKLECDVKAGEDIMVGSHPARIFAIDSWGKIVETVKAGEYASMMVRNIAEVPVEAGWEVTKSL